jgi:hypothetical protein
MDGDPHERFAVSLTAGLGTWASLSDRNATTDIAPLDDDSIPARVAALPIDSWRRLDAFAS